MIRRFPTDTALFLKSSQPVIEGYAHKRSNISSFDEMCKKAGLIVFLLAMMIAPYMAAAQVTPGAVSRSQCVTVGGTPQPFTSLRDASTGVIEWEKDTGPAFLTATVVGGAQAFTETAAINATTYYRRKITSGVVSAYSNTLTVSVVGATNNPTFIPVAVSPICEGNTSFTVSYTTSNSPTRYSIIWDAIPSGLGFADVAEANLPAASPLTVNVPANAPVNTTYFGTLIPMDANGCTIAGTHAPFTFNPKPTVQINTPAAVCAPNTVNLTSTAVTAGSTLTPTFTQWTNPAATTTLVNPATVSVSNTYYIKGTTAAGCFDIKPVVATINPLPTVTITSGGPTTFCSGNTVTLSTTGGISYAWNSGQTTASIVVSSSGSRFVALTDVNGCSASSTNTVITVNVSPTVNVTNPAPVCAPTTINLTSSAITSGSSPGLSYFAYTDAAATTSFIGAPSASISGVYYVKGIAANSCFVIKPVTVTINPLPGVNINDPATVCTPATVDLTAASVTAGSTPGLTFTRFTDINGTIPLANDNAVNTGGTYYIKGTTTAGCSVIKPVAFGINVSPTVIITDPTAVCAPTILDLTDPAIVAGSSGGLLYTHWRDTSATIPLNNPFSVTIRATYFIKGSHFATGCETIKAVHAVINPMPAVAVANLPTICMPATINLTALTATTGSSAGLNFTYWRDALTTTALTTPNAVSITGTYYIKGTFTNTGCSLVQPAVVNIITKPSVNIDNPIAVCEPTTVDLTNTIVTDGTTAGLTFSYWSDSANTISLATPKAIPTAGTYYVRGALASGCFTSVPVPVVINLLPNGILQTPAVNFVCDGAMRVLTATNAFAYQWYANDQLLVGETGATYGATAAGHYTVQFISKDGCVKSATNIIRLGLVVKPAVRYTLNSHCITNPVIFSNTTSVVNSGTITWAWDFGDGTTSTNISPPHTYLQPGTYNVVLTANNSSCPNLTTNTTTPFTFEKAETGIRYETIEATNGKPFVLNARPIGVSYLWKPASGLNSTISRTPIANLTADTTYTVTITSAADCLTTDTVSVKITTDGAVYVATGFTPNGDGVNDRAYPILRGVRQLTYFKIFNRWGNMVFQTNDATPQNGWDGKYLGKLQPTGTYAWTMEGIDGNGNLIHKSGNLILIL